jgi:hypothetical protein
MYRVLSVGRCDETPSALEAAAYVAQANFTCRIFSGTVEIDLPTLDAHVRRENAEINAIAGNMPTAIKVGDRVQVFELARGAMVTGVVEMVHIATAYVKFDKPQWCRGTYCSLIELSPVPA